MQIGLTKKLTLVTDKQRRTVIGFATYPIQDAELPATAMLATVQLQR